MRRSTRYTITKPVESIGLVSDTHGVLRPEVSAALAGVDLIIHGGDIGKPEVIAGLRKLAPVYAVRGNNDRGPWARRFPDTLTLNVQGIKLHVIHALQDLDCDPEAAGFRAVISGHSHKPGVVRRGGVLYINPGSAGPRRFKLPVALGRIRVTASGELHPELIDLVSSATIV